MPPDLRLWPNAVREAAQRWYPEAKATIEELSALDRDHRLSETIIAEKATGASWLTNTARQLLDYLYAGQLAAYYFVDAFGWQMVQSEFWSSPYAEDALRSGWFWPFGRRQRQPSYQLYLVRSEFEALFLQANLKKGSFKPSMMPALKALVRECADIKPRAEQFRLIREKFPARLTDKLLRGVVKDEQPRDPGRGRKSK
jgi:hypothetical protein